MVQVRRLLPGDAELAARTINAIKPPQERDNASVLVDNMRKFLADDRNMLIVASEGEAPVGFTLAYRLPRVDRERSMVLFYEIEVVDSRRRSGVATAMVSRLKEICRDQHILKMWVSTEEHNEAASRLYESMGGRRGPSGSVEFTWKGEDFL